MNWQKSLKQVSIFTASDHPWLGNIRQLTSVIKVIVALADSQVIVALADSQVIDHSHMPEDFMEDLEALSRNAPSPEEHDVNEYSNNKQNTTITVFHNNDGNISRTAKALGISRNTLYKRLKSLGIRE